MRFLKSFVLMVGLLLNSLSVYADNALLARKDVHQFVQHMVRDYHFKSHEITTALRQAQFQPQIVASMDKPFEMKTWDVYQNLFLTPDRVQAGISFWQNNEKALARAEHEYGVPAEIIVAIIGVETLYGKHQGNYRVLDALTTLAFYYPKRSSYFTKELAEFFLLCREHHVNPTLYTGSYAGAMGKPQFMPSSYRFYAVDFKGTGFSDLMHNDSDAIASVANFFHRHGWKPNSSVAQRVAVQGQRYRALAVNSRAPDYTVQHLLRQGVRPVNALQNHVHKAGLLEFNTANGQEYWMAYPNFYVITHYNRSPQYAMVVYLFSQQLHMQWAKLNVHRASV